MQSKDDDQFSQLKSILSTLFPEFGKTVDSGFMFGAPERLDAIGDKRIRYPSIFPAYFRYELPQGLFSSVELESFLGRIMRTPADEDRQRMFLEELSSMEKGSSKRDDFLRKLSDAVQSIPVDVAKAILFGAMKAADQYVYDSMFMGSAEGGHVLRIVIRVAEKCPSSERLSLLSQCITDATDDTMAFRIVNNLTGKRSDFDLNVSKDDLYPYFAERMRQRYGRDVDVSNLNLSTSDVAAFNLWGQKDPKDREVQHDFWVRYIGQSRVRLAQSFQTTIMPIAIYQTDPTPFVENKISVSDLKRLYETLPADNSLTESDQKSLRRLKRFLDGEFKNGVDILNANDDA